MNISCSQEDLDRGLGVVGRAVATRTTLPITSHIMLVAEGKKLKLAATNLEIALSCWIPAQIQEEGSITIPARLLMDFVASLPNERIEMALSPRSRQVRLVCARNEATIGGMDADDFPPIPTVQGGATIKLEPGALRRTVNQVVFAAATDDSRPVLTGVHVLADGDQITLAAADGFRLAVNTVTLKDKVPEHIEVIVPARALSELARLLGEQSEPVEMTLNANKTQVLFKLTNIELVAQLINGTFPKYSQLIPPSFQSRAVVDASEFLRETRIASIFARDGSGIVRIQFAPGESKSTGRMTITARAEEVGDNRGEIDAAVEGEESKIAFNGKYLQDVLAVLDGGKVALETTSPSQPGVIKPQDDPNYVHVVMPMFVQW